MKTLSLLTVWFGMVVSLYAQSGILKNEALKAAKAGDYREAIGLLEEAKEKTPEDPQVYYYLGVFMHYLAYDSAPLVGYDSTYSDKIIRNLESAVELKPDYGDAYYFIGAQYGADALDGLRNGDPGRYKSAFQIAFQKGAFPEWVIEYDKNMLRSCGKDAILFVAGDIEFDPIQYLQLIENYRTDVTVIPFALLERPWYVATLKKGSDGIVRKIPISLSMKQIFDMHSYKWDTMVVNIPISGKLKERFKLPQSEVMRWKIAPDMRSDEKTFLSPGLAVLMNIIQSNKWNRPIYFSLGFGEFSFPGLRDHFQLSGTVYKLLPIVTEKTDHDIDTLKIEEVLLNENHLKDFKDVDRHDMPRVSGILYNYYGVLYRLAIYFKGTGQAGRIKQLESYVKKYLITDTLKNGNTLLEMMNKLTRE